MKQYEHKQKRYKTYIFHTVSLNQYGLWGHVSILCAIYNTVSLANGLGAKQAVVFNQTRFQAGGSLKLNCIMESTRDLVWVVLGAVLLYRFQGSMYPANFP